MCQAAEQNNVFASFMNMCSLYNMLSEISSQVAIGTYNIMEEYNRLSDLNKGD